jgi:hypothetical protein
VPGRLRRRDPRPVTSPSACSRSGAVIRRRGGSCGTHSVTSCAGTRRCRTSAAPLPTAGPPNRPTGARLAAGPASSHVPAWGPFRNPGTPPQPGKQ